MSTDSTTPAATTPTIPTTLPDGHQLVVPVIRRPTYSLGYEGWEHLVFLHLHLHGATAADADALSRDVATCGEQLGQPLHALVPAGEDGFGRILSELGFRPAGEAVNHLGQPVAVLVREPQPAVVQQDGRPN